MPPLHLNPPYRALNLRVNPFGALEPDVSARLAVTDVEPWLSGDNAATGAYVGTMTVEVPIDLEPGGLHPRGASPATPPRQPKRERPIRPVSPRTS